MEKTFRSPVVLILWILYGTLSGQGLGSFSHAPHGSHHTQTVSHGWQYGRTVAECNQYMLDNQLATDIALQVGPKDGARSLIRAHKYVLMSRSAVFTKLLQQKSAIDKDLLIGSPTDDNSTILLSRHPITTIEIPDMDPGVFRQMLNFVYTDRASLDIQNVIPLMYAAKKYQLPLLITECQWVLQHNISLENVCSILNQAIYFKETQLINKSLEFIGNNAEHVLKSDGFRRLSNEAFGAVIAYDRLSVNETSVFAASIRWAEFQISMKNLTRDLIDKALVRTILGDFIYRIRFPVMGQREFAELLGMSDFLTCGEKASIYYYIATLDHRNNSLRFDWKRRIRKVVLDRFDYFREENWECGSARSVEKIQVAVNKSVILKGIGTYHLRSSNNHYYNHMQSSSVILSVTVTRSDYQYGQSHFREVRVGGTQSYVFTLYDNPALRDQIIEIPLDEEVILDPKYFYTISLHLPSPVFCYSGYGNNNRGRNPIQSVGVSFTFYGAGTSTDSSRGQIPRLYFYA